MEVPADPFDAADDRPVDLLVVDGFRLVPEREEDFEDDFDVDPAAGLAEERADFGREETPEVLDADVRDDEAFDDEAFEDFVDVDLEAGGFCFVATGVRDSLVAPSARRCRWYRSGTPSGRMRRKSTFGHVRRHRGTTFSLTPKGYL